MARSDTLFDILLRQPWWVTLLVGVAVFAIAHAVFPPVAPFMVIPFGLLCAFIAYKQWRGGSAADAGERLAAVRAMDWDEFRTVVTNAYQRRGYDVLPAQGAGYDLRLTRDDRTTLLQCRRWKVNQVGVGALRELAKAIEREEAGNGICITVGGFSVPARDLASREPITLIAGDELAALVGAVPS